MHDPNHLLLARVEYQHGFKPESEIIIQVSKLCYFSQGYDYEYC